MNYSWWLSFCQVPPILNYPGTDSMIFGLYRPLPLPFLLHDVCIWTISLLIRASGKKVLWGDNKVKLRIVILYLLSSPDKKFQGKCDEQKASGMQSGLCCLYVGFYYSLFPVSFILEHLGFSHRESWLRKQNLSLIFIS